MLYKHGVQTYVMGFSGAGTSISTDHSVEQDVETLFTPCSFSARSVLHFKSFVWFVFNNHGRFREDAPTGLLHLLESLQRAVLTLGLCSMFL